MWSVPESPNGRSEEGLLAGTKVIELAHFVFGPATGAVLADWGAEVVKIEHPEHGDPARGVVFYGLDPGPERLTCLFDTFNRGKRDMAIDVSTSEGREIVLKLSEQADVFLTSFLAPVRRRLGLDAPDVLARNPAIIYAQASGQGPEGDDADAPGFDLTSFWYRSGLSSGVTPKSSSYALGLPGPGFGDTVSGMALAGAIAAALVRRQRTGVGSVVDVSLLQTGLFTNQASMVATDLFGLDELVAEDRARVSNPLVNVYRTSDGRFIALAMLQADRYWEGFCGAIGRADLASDPRFIDMVARREHRELCISQLDALFASAPLNEWVARLSTQSGPWTVVVTAAEAKRDRQVAQNEYMVPIRHGSGREIHVVRAPGTSRSGSGPQAAPAFGADTDEILMNHLGMDLDAVLDLKIKGVIG